MQIVDNLNADPIDMGYWLVIGWLYTVLANLICIV